MSLLINEKLSVTISSAKMAKMVQDYITKNAPGYYLSKGFSIKGPGGEYETSCSLDTMTILLSREQRQVAGDNPRYSEHG